ncbi:Hsp20/alpha crystallin family protein [Candidatus Uhrbacteria bacterium]|nr:Hsp20/alpha crystallin family protein [Candidatus Uhrbacteria bacterium]
MQIFSPNEWASTTNEGQLSVDVFRDGEDLVVRSTVAGVKPEDLDISIHGDLLTIRGKRSMVKEVPEDDWYYRECFWGAFSRSLVLPYEVATDLAQASLKNGVLEIRVPVREHGKKVDIAWEE